MPRAAGEDAALVSVLVSAPRRDPGDIAAGVTGPTGARPAHVAHRVMTGRRVHVREAAHT
ncbi:hypothetical protein ACFY20_27725 [Streptomyces sp. NPDC001312]|uniref:hypothetical protein n=1 Tax=Streptomyces sp. NPDC001312 TaxID=3364561 RepID=UPI00368E9381